MHRSEGFFISTREECMKEIIGGKAFVLGNDIDTDQIIPAAHLVYKLDDLDEKKNYDVVWEFNSKINKWTFQLKEKKNGK